MTAREDYNWVGAIFSFLRVLAVAEATAFSTLLLNDSTDPISLRASLIAAALALCLTVVNFFRDGETRYGTPPNPGRPEDGY